MFRYHRRQFTQSKLVLLVLMLLTARQPSIVHAGNNVWTPLGPEGGAIYSLAVDPTAHDTIYAGTGTGIYKSANGGSSWTPINSGLTDNQYYNDVYAIQINPQSTNTVYAATFNGVFKSTNGGATWTVTSMRHRAEAFAMDPQNSATLYASWAFGVYKSTDSGTTWSDQSTGLNNNSVIALAIDPKTPSTLYAGAYNGLFKSVNGGASWSEVTIGATTDKRVTAIVINPQNTAILYLAMVDGIMKSADGGTTWNNVLSGWSNTLAIDPANPTTLYAATVGGLYKSTNSGGTWSKSNVSILSSARAVVIDPAAPATLYIGTYSAGIYKSGDSGGGWNAVNTGLYNTTITRLLVHPQTPNVLYVLANSLLYKSTDSGAHWQLLTPELRYGDNQQTGQINTLIVHPQTATTLYAGTDAGPFKSTDGGATWSWLYSCSFFCFLPYVTTLALSPTAPETVYMGSIKTLVTSASLSRSDNGGSSWTYAGTGLPHADVNVIVVDPQNAARVYAGTDKGLYVTTNKGDAWTAAGAGLPVAAPVYTLVIDPTDNKRIFAGVSGSIYKSSDSGANWQAVTGGANGAATNALVLDPLQTNRLYATDNHGVINSEDGGASWGTFNSGLTSRSVYALAIDAKTPTILYAGTSNHGVYTRRIVAVPQITTQPASQTIDNQQPATLTVVVTDSQSLTYQWYQGNSGDTSTPIPGATTNTLTTPPLSTTTSYWVRVTNTGGGSVDSETAIITVNVVQAPVILVQPRSQTINLSQSATISVTAAGTAPLTYQWYGGNRSDTSAPIAGATGAGYTTPALAITTNYWVRVSNSQGTVDSETAIITVLTPPVTQTPTATTTPTQTVVISHAFLPSVHTAPLPAATPTPTPTGTPTPTPTLTPAPGTPGAGIYDGVWRGTTSQDKNISFRIQEHGFAFMSVDFFFSLTGCSTSGPTSFFVAQPIKFTGNTFSVAVSRNTTVSGTFDSATASAGELRVVVNEPFCVGSGSATWTAAKTALE